jgi:hypothetical protein
VSEKKPPFKVDGKRTERATEAGVEYAVWRVLTREGDFACAFFGPNSLACAQTACDAMNEAESCLSPSMPAFQD